MYLSFITLLCSLPLNYCFLKVFYWIILVGKQLASHSRQLVISMNNPEPSGLDAVLGKMLDICHLRFSVHVVQLGRVISWQLALSQLKHTCTRINHNQAKLLHCMTLHNRHTLHLYSTCNLYIQLKSTSAWCLLLTLASLIRSLCSPLYLVKMLWFSAFMCVCGFGPTS